MIYDSTITMQGFIYRLQLSIANFDQLPKLLIRVVYIFFKATAQIY